MSTKYARHVEIGLSFGIVSFDRFTIEPNDKPWDAPARPWVTAYRVAGPRIRGTVRISPRFDEPTVAWHSDTPNERDREFLPSGLHVGYGRADYNQSEGSLEVWGSRLVDGVDVSTKRETKRNFSVRRIESGIGDYPAPRGVTEKTRELIWALVGVHQEDTALVHEQAVAYLRDRRDDRLAVLRRESAAVEEALRELQGRHVELQARKSGLEGAWSFENAIEESAPAA